MVFPDEFKQRPEALQAVVQRNLAQIDNLDRRLQEVKKQNLDLFSQAIYEMTQIISARYTMPNFSVEALAEKQSSLTVDENIKWLGQYMEEIDARLHRYERALSAACSAASSSSSSSSCTLNTDTPTRFGRSPRRAGSRQTRAHLAAELQSVTDVEMPIDQNGGTYCICHKNSYGLMIGCDNPNCKIEWFHFECVGLKGKWYCPDCAPLQKDCKGK